MTTPLRRPNPRLNQPTYEHPDVDNFPLWGLLVFIFAVVVGLAVVLYVMVNL